MNKEDKKLKNEEKLFLREVTTFSKGVGRKNVLKIFGKKMFISLILLVRQKKTNQIYVYVNSVLGLEHI